MLDTPSISAVMSETFPRVGSAVIVRDEANRILLGKRNKDPQRGCWVLPGGKIHAFERIAEAAAREMEEETGLKIEVQNQFRVYEIINPPSEHRIVIYSWGKIVGGNPKPSDDLSEITFASLEELGALPTTPLVRQVLMDAGFIAEETKPVPQRHTQLSFSIFPILVAGANQGSKRRRGGGAGTHRRRARTLSNTPLLFDDNVVG